MSQFTKEYRLFFTSPAGEDFMQHLQNLIKDFHVKAEDEPDRGRDYLQQSKGVREVLNHITTVTAERKAEKHAVVSQ